MVLLRAFAVWLLIIAAEILHGIMRTALLVPLIGDLPARQLGVGLLWVVLTVVFEVGLGRLVLGLPWGRIAEDYDPTRGGLLWLGLLFMAVSPLLADRARGRKPQRTGPSP